MSGTAAIQANSISRASRVPKFVKLGTVLRPGGLEVIPASPCISETTQLFVSTGFLYAGKTAHSKRYRQNEQWHPAFLCLFSSCHLSMGTGRLGGAAVKPPGQAPADRAATTVTTTSTSRSSSRSRRSKKGSGAESERASKLLATTTLAEEPRINRLRMSPS